MCIRDSTTYDGDEDIYRALQAGARAYLLKGMTSEELIASIRSVHAGSSYIPPAIAQKLAERVGTEELTARESEAVSYTHLDVYKRQMDCLRYRAGWRS